MVYSFAVMAVALTIVALRCAGGMRTFLICCALLNCLAAGKAIYTGDPYAFKLKPNSSGQQEERIR